MLEQLAALKEEHLTLIGFVTFFVMFGVTVLGSVLATQWRKARQTEMELWFKHEMHARGMSIPEIERLMGGKSDNDGGPAHRLADPPHRPAFAAMAQPVSFERRLVRPTKEAYLGGLCVGIANYLNISATAFRLVFGFVVLCTGIFPLLIGYFIACCFVPSDRDAVAAIA